MGPQEPQESRAARVSKRDAEHYAWGASCDGWHLVKRDDLSILHERMPPGTSEARHFHNAARQFFFILQGRATMEMDGRVLELGPHEGVEVAPGVPHTMMNKSDEDVEFLVVSHPKAHGDRVPA